MKTNVLMRRTNPVWGRLAGLAALAAWSLSLAGADGQPTGVVATDPAPPPRRAPQPEPYEEIPPIEGEGWRMLFDGKTLKGWTITDYAGRGDVRVKDGMMILEMGAMLTGVNGPTNLFKTNYELVYDAMRLDGTDFFGTVTFPVGDSCCSLVLGGWGGGVVGISSLDGMDASENSTSTYIAFKDKQWYRVRIRVTLKKIECWIGKLKVVDEDISYRKVTVRPGEIELSQPFGFATWVTTGALRNIMWRPLD